MFIMLQQVSRVSFLFFMIFFFKLLIEFVTILFLFSVLVFWPPGMLDLGSQTWGSKPWPLYWKTKS